ncbi:MAG: betaine--homocysteine S-methyltransferase [Rhodospirillaceae bacterium]|nr:MAG: betaine--homocysteine S-methyltransferase [Rhodospirillaceae bacterium]
MTNRFLQLLQDKPFLMADGATGTNLFLAGLMTGDSPETWNFLHPEKITALHQSFVDAGSDVILTNSFGGTRHRLKLHGDQDKVYEINKRAAEIARAVADKAMQETPGRVVIVGGSIGPTGELFQPLGALTEEDGIAAFEEQAIALRDGGVDVLWIETMSAREEVAAAVKGAAKAGLPIVTTCSFDTNGRTMMGITPADFAQFVHTLDPKPVAYGANCGVGASDLTATILQMAAAAQPGDIIVAKGNCGIPFYEEGKIKYNGTPELMGDYAKLVRDAGARIVGGCCGTSPEHLESIRASLDSHTPGEKPTLETITSKLGPLTSGAEASLSGHAPAGGGDSERRGRRRRASADDASF